MKEAQFIKKQKAKWHEFEQMLKSRQRVNADELVKAYIGITDDLAYARTHLPDSPATEYLNSLAGQIHRKVYSNQKHDKNRVFYFFTHELPLIFYDCRRFILISLAVMIISGAIGALSAAYDDRFVRLILGDGYVNMTLQNIEKGDPMAVYKQQGEGVMFLGISINNIRVSFLAFVLGILASVGTIMVLFKNGVMIGSFQYFFHEYDLLFESARTVWIHGTLEVYAIVMAGAAGICMGNSMLFPGSKKRIVSLVQGTKKGAKIILGMIPVFIVAAFLEGYVTRHTGMPMVLNMLIIGCSFAFAVWYTFVYPNKLVNQQHSIVK